MKFYRNVNSLFIPLVLVLFLVACDKNGNFNRNIPIGQGIESVAATKSGLKLKAQANFSVDWTIRDPAYKDVEVFIELSTNLGTTWSEVGRVPATRRTYSLGMPNYESSQIQIRAYYLDKTGMKHYFYQTDPIIVDANSPIINFDPLGSVGVLKGGSVKTVSWSASDTSFDANPVSLYYSVDKGVSWALIIKSQPAVGSYSWTLPSINASNVQIKAVAQDHHGRSSESLSDTSFSIDSTGPEVTLSSPVAGAVWNGLTKNTISWNYFDAYPSDRPISLELSNDGGATFVVLKKKMQNSGLLVVESADIASLVDSTNCVLKITAEDRAGNQTVVLSPVFELSRTRPQLTLTQNNIVYGNQDSYTFSGTCDRSAVMSENPGVLVTPAATPLTSSTVPCNGVSDVGTWTFSSNQNVDGSYGYKFSQKNNVAQGSLLMEQDAMWIRDTIAPSMSSLTVENGAEYTNKAFVNVSVSGSDNSAFPLVVELQEATDGNAGCSFDHAEKYQQLTANANFPFTIRMQDGPRKICARMIDQAGNVSAESSTLINYEGNSPPTISLFSATNVKDGSNFFNPGDVVNIAWTVSDTSALSTSPINIDYTLDGATWIPLIKKYGSLPAGAKEYSGTYTQFTAPSSFFMLRLFVEDGAGNKSFRFNSDPLNTQNWSVFAGSLDNGIGGALKTLSFPNSTSASQGIAVNPKTGDILTVSGLGVVSINPISGASSIIMYPGSGLQNWSQTGLSENGGTYTKLNLYLGFLSLFFDSHGLLYINVALPSNIYAARVYQIDLEKKTSRLYAGGGTHLDAKQLAGVTPQSLATHLGPIPFDEDNSLYMNVPCSSTAGEVRMQLVKIPQLADKTAGSPVHIAGNCANGDGLNDVVATETPFATSSYYLYSSLVVRERGKYLYVAPYGKPVYKIVNGRHYTTSITTGIRGLSWSQTDNHLYVVHNSAAHDLIHKWANLGLAQAGGETAAGVVLSYKGTSPDCWDDDIFATNACSFLDLAMTHDRNNRLLFLDGLRLNTTGGFRIRFVDPTGRVQTLAGTKPFYGKDLDKMSFKATGLGSIFYKSTTEVGSVWAPGLYFSDKIGQVFGYIGADNKTRILWGNQVERNSSVIPTGTPISPDISLGYRYANNGGVMTFSSEGVPWLRVSNRILSIDKEGKVVARQTGAISTLWHSSTVPSTSAMHVAGLNQNFSMKKDNIVFLMGKYVSPLNTAVDAPKISAFNFGTDTVVNILGPVGGPTPAPDQLSPTNLSTSNLSSVCANYYCALQFIENNPNLETDDELFFIEGMKLRKITNPLNPGAQTLQTVLNFPSDLITLPWGVQGEYNQMSNFFITQDKSRVFYLNENKIYCSMLNEASSKWCNGTSIGPFSGVGDIPKIASQFTMLDSDSLLISTGRVVLRFDFPSD